MSEQEKTAGQKMRDFYLENKEKSKKDSKELAELLKKKDESKNHLQDKVARHFTLDGAGGKYNGWAEIG